jgi:hypothetical protein
MLAIIARRDRTPAHPRDVFKSVANLEAAIEAWIAECNSKPRPLQVDSQGRYHPPRNARAAL